MRVFEQLQKIGGLPGNVLDVWQATGEREHAKYTWDMSRNDNLGMSGRFKPRLRFDRMLVRFPKDETATKFKPVYFELVGLSRIRACGRFPSDHWGIMGHLDRT